MNRRAFLLGAGAGAIAPSLPRQAFAIGTNFGDSLLHVLKHEGGFSNHAADPGGRTLEGITQAVYDVFRRRKGLPRILLTAAMRGTDAWIDDRNEIYRELYWDLVGGDGLARGLDYTVFDYGVHSGIRRAVTVLERCVGMEGRGLEAAIAEAARRPSAPLIRWIWDERGRFHAALIAQRPPLATFRNGWANRRSTGRVIALQMAGPGVRAGSSIEAGYGPVKAAFDPEELVP